jgi:hypothetical protein
MVDRPRILNWYNMRSLFRLMNFISAVAHVLCYVECRVRIINLNSHGLFEAPGRGRRLFLLQNLPDRLWGPFRLLFNGYCGSFPEVSGRSVNMATYLRLVPRLRMSGGIFLTPHTPSWRGLRKL